MPLRGLGLVAYLRGELAAAEALLEEGLALMRERGDAWSGAMVLHDLAGLAHLRGQPERAAGLYGESLAIWRDLGNPRGVALCVAGLAGVALHRGRPEQAARLLGAAEAMREAAGGVPEPSDLPAIDRHVGALRAALGEARYARISPKDAPSGRVQAIAEALSLTAPHRRTPPRRRRARGPAARGAAGRWRRLTPRELEVAGLLASGLTNRQLAERLFITEGTAALPRQAHPGQAGLRVAGADHRLGAAPGLGRRTRPDRAGSAKISIAVRCGIQFW